jgi:hypothetical protein
MTELGQKLKRMNSIMKEQLNYGLLNLKLLKKNLMIYGMGKKECYIC